MKRRTAMLALTLALSGTCGCNRGTSRTYPNVTRESAWSAMQQVANTHSMRLSTSSVWSRSFRPTENKGDGTIHYTADAIFIFSTTNYFKVRNRWFRDGVTITAKQTNQPKLIPFVRFRKAEKAENAILDNVEQVLFKGSSPKRSTD